MSESCWSLRQRWPVEGLPVGRKSDSNTDWPSPETGPTSPEQSQAIGGCQWGSLITELARSQDNDQFSSSCLRDVSFRLWRQLLSWPVAVRAVTAVA